MYDLKRRKQFAGPTVKDIREYLSTLPDDMLVLTTGTPIYYSHVDTDSNFVSFDESDLSELYEED